MSEFTNPSDIARETLRQLAARRIAPNPENYRQHYQEIAGALDKAAGEKNWPRYRSTLLEMIEAKTSQGAGAPVWAQLILDLIKQWDSRHSGLTTARKRENLERILGAPGTDATSLATKLQKLVKTWSQTAAAQAEQTELARNDTEPPNAQEQRRTGGLTPATAAPAEVDGAAGEWRDLLAQTLEFAVVTQLAHAPDLAEEAGRLAQSARAAENKAALARLTSALKQFWYKLEVRGGVNDELHRGLLRLLRLLIDNTHELLGEDQWLRGQVALLQQIVARPLDLDAIAEAEKRLKEVIYKQGTLRNSLQEAKDALKRLITSFIDRLGGLSESTTGYHNRLEGYAQKIRQADDISQLNAVLEDLLEDTRSVQLDTVRTRDELLAARRQVEAAELKVRELENELDKVSGLVQEDQLTGVLNRRGLEDAYEREVARAERGGTPLSVGLLDIDNFKLLNDTHGHQAGDDALQHLVRVIKRTMRPTDVLARYGGEEFMLLLPDTRLEEAVEVMIRLQRNLTKAFFMHNNERVLITFSAGVALRAPDESRSAIIERADKAMYQAKKSGKNRVCPA